MSCTSFCSSVCCITESVLVAFVVKHKLVHKGCMIYYCMQKKNDPVLIHRHMYTLQATIMHSVYNLYVLHNSSWYNLEILQACSVTVFICAGIFRVHFSHSNHGCSHWSPQQSLAVVAHWPLAGRMPALHVHVLGQCLYCLMLLLARSCHRWSAVQSIYCCLVLLMDIVATLYLLHSKW